jgi:acetylornithine deacetylase
MKTIEAKITKLLCDLIETPSLSREEGEAAMVVQKFLQKENIPFETLQHNTWTKNRYFNPLKPTILLNSHIDTVKPVNSWTKDPYKAVFEDDKLYGLGVNDAGAALVSLLGAFLYFYDKEDLRFNLIFAATAEEEISGKNGVELIENVVNKCSFAIVGEPTEMEMAVAEKGLMVIDAEVKGKSGHAARNEGVNAIYTAVKDLMRLENYQFKKINPYVGAVKATVTMIQAGTQHNVIPDICKYVIDVRTIPEYTHEQILEILQDNLKAAITPRSTRLKPSQIDKNHAIVKAAEKTGINTFGSATLSDQTLIAIPSVKIGPGKSERSHTADEFIFVKEIEQGLTTYVKLLERLEII